MTAPSYRVVLGPPDVELARSIGNERADWVQRTGASKGLHTRLDRRYSDLHAAGSELVAARFTDREWTMTTLPGRDRPDVLPDIEVRWSRRAAGDLAVYANDHLERRFVLVVGELPEYDVVGWIGGTEALRIRDTVEGIWRDDERGGWYVPRRFLLDADELRAAVPA